MVGRRRRTSDSTIATVYDTGRSYASELSVLKKFDESLDLENPLLQTFVLEDATVWDKNGRLVELFTVKTQGPFVVRGRVIIEEWQKSRAQKASTKSALIETRECTRYAIGDSDTGYGVWAGTSAGWYEIKPPSAAYREIYDHTIEGVSIYYLMLDIIEGHNEAQEPKRGKKKRGRKPASPSELTIEQLLFKYAVHVGDGATYEEVMARFDDHALFLISHFYEDHKTFDWTPTVLFKWIVARHPDIHAKVLEAQKNTKKKKPAVPGPTLPNESEAVAQPTATDEPPAQKALSKRRQRNTPSESNVSNNDTDVQGLAISQREMRSRSRGKTKTQSRSPPPRHPYTTEESMGAMELDGTPEIQAPTTELVETAHNRSNVDALLDGLEELKPELIPLNKAAFSKVASKLYYKYKIKVYYASSEILKYYAKELIERLNGNEWSGSGFWNTLQEAAQGPRPTLQNITLDKIPEALVRRKLVAGTFIGHRGSKTAKLDSDKEEGLADATIETPPPRRVGRPAGKMSALRLAGTSGKRRFDSMDATPETVSRTKIVKTSHSYSSDEEEAMDTARSSEDDDSELSTDSPVALKVVVRAENIPTTIPKGPSGTWVCDEDNCGFIERNPDTDEGRERIQDHMRDAHYQNDEDQAELINLAVTEGGKNHLPIEYIPPTPSTHFSYSSLPDMSGVSPFWEFGRSRQAINDTAPSTRPGTFPGAADEDILPLTLNSIAHNLHKRSSK
ncbi:hypothetical protein CCHL11_07627 [Colletotrichum chlorophyti]|uniref:RFTS domain-containing protein n=1 Tax=Colletotrichum chlorophyti TaxID=708187 RepID=A0A1Q8RCN8_9PEZI|nr:hypothetical protein CCHL11_07627 [Colletotrichum chlorophyti]